MQMRWPLPREHDTKTGRRSCSKGSGSEGNSSDRPTRAQWWLACPLRPGYGQPRSLSEWDLEARPGSAHSRSGKILLEGNVDEHMRTPSILRPKLRRLIALERLDDFASFAGGDVDHEVPLYSRYKQVAFLEGFGRETADRLLLQFGLDALDTFPRLGLVAPGMLIALTVDRHGKGEPIIPKIFASNPSSAARFKGRYRLREPRTTLGRWLVRMIRNLGEVGRFLVLEEATAAVPGHPRVFIGHRPEFAPGLMTIDQLGPATVSSESRIIASNKPNRRAAKVSTP